MKKKIQVDNNGRKYILFRIDIYFSECSLAVEINKKGLTEILFLKKKDKKHQKKNLVVNLLELIQVMQKMVMIQIMSLVIQKHLLMSSKIKKIKELEKKLIEEKKETETRKRNERTEK